MKWLLDTNVISESGRTRPSSKVMAWLAIQPRIDTAVSAVTWAELQEGVLSAPEPKRLWLKEWLDDAVVPLFRDKVLPLTNSILIDWLRLSRELSAERSTRRAADLLIASTARVHNLTLVSRNLRDFAGTGVTVYNPWTDTTERMESV
jgi:predicted nucleic acid-binding protein